MQCPKCTTSIPAHHVAVADSREIIGFEIRFSCRGCGREFRCIVPSVGFVEVVPAEVPTVAETVTILSNAGVAVDEAVVEGWSGKKRTLACNWAIAACWEAAGPPMPGFLEEYQVPFLEVT